jgi:hypothetical protein
MNKSFYYFLLLIFAFITLESKAQLSQSDVQVNIDYVVGNLTVTWKDDPGGSSVCRAFSQDEKVFYQIGTGPQVNIFDNTTGGSIATNSVTNYPPGNFFTNNVTITVTGKHGNTNEVCSPPITSNVVLPINTRIENPQSLTATNDASCASVDLTWNPPSIVSGASRLRFELFRRPANSTGTYTTVNTNISGNATTYTDVGAPAGIEQEYLVKTKMLYYIGGTRTATTIGAKINGRKIGVAGNPSGVFIDQANCNGDLDVNWNWSNSNNPNNFEVYKATNSTFRFRPSLQRQ